MATPSLMLVKEVGALNEVTFKVQESDSEGGREGGRDGGRRLT